MAVKNEVTTKAQPDAQEYIQSLIDKANKATGNFYGNGPGTN